MFGLLKVGCQEPDAGVAAEVGLTDIEAAAGDVANPAARDMLLRMPGVTPANVWELMRACTSLAQLADMSSKSLQNAIGATAGRTLHTFLHMPYQADR
jgi:ERCC4-type nuclease